jgi:hypothetical protein
MRVEKCSLLERSGVEEFQVQFTLDYIVRRFAVDGGAGLKVRAGAQINFPGIRQGCDRNLKQQAK